MRTALVGLQSVSPLSWSKHYFDPPKEEKEDDADYERRTWRERFHCTKDGHVSIPPMAFKGCLENAAQYLSMKIKGRGRSTYTKHFKSGILVQEPLVLPLLKDDVVGEWFFVPSNGQRGGSKRVWKCFPVIAEWSGEVTFFILDNTITEEVFQAHLTEAGNFIGIGRFRPQNGGFYGRFQVKGIKWS